MTEVPPARIPEEPGAVIPHAGICEGTPRNPCPYLNRQYSITLLHMPAEATVDFADLIDWYRSQCDDSWEHQHGIKLATLDNPGWMLTVDLIGTDLQGKPMIELREGVSPTAHPVSPFWMQCSVTDNQFRGACDPSQVARLFNVFNQFRCSPNPQI